MRDSKLHEKAEQIKHMHLFNLIKDHQGQSIKCGYKNKEIWANTI